MKYSALLIISILFFFCSCHKDSNTSNNNNNNDTSAITLKRFVITDPSLSAPNDTITRTIYSYDNSNRCIQVNSYADGDSFYIYNYYNGSDTLIAKRKLVFVSSADSAWEYFNYDAAGRELLDSIVYLPSAGNPSGGNLSYHYQLPTSGYHVVSVITSYGNPVLMGAYDIFPDGVGKIISEHDSGFVYQAGTGFVYNDTSTLTISYDSHPCPFYKLYPRRVVETDYENDLEDFGPIYWAILQENNIVQEGRVASALTPFDHIFDYTYNSNGYPSSFIFTDYLNSTTLKGYYFY